MIFCVRTVSHTARNTGQTRSFTGTRRRTSMQGEIVDRKCVGGIWCASARAAEVDFQACSFNHSDISPFRINDLRAVDGRIIARCFKFCGSSHRRWIQRVTSGDAPNVIRIVSDPRMSPDHLRLPSKRRSLAVSRYSRSGNCARVSRSLSERAVRGSRSMNPRASSVMII
jgi:hypothetical protein